jgi:excisionase family DNA binding protein
MSSQFLSLEEAAKKLGITTDQLVAFRSEGKIRGFRDGASWKFPANELDRLADDLAGDGPDGFEIAGRGGRKTRFDDVDPELGERGRNAQLFVEGHAAARGLLAVSQRGVENHDAIVVCGVHPALLAPATGRQYLR